MGSKMRETAALTGVLLMGVSAIASANLITYVEQGRNREKLIVMEENGTNPVELFVGGRRSPAIEGPTVSPAGLEDPWVLFNQSDIYRIRPDGSGQDLVLCVGGTDKDGAPYYIDPWVGVWAPDGSQILFQSNRSSDGVGETFLALLPADHTANESCASELIEIYKPLSPWYVDAGPAAWNHDGSRIAFWETNKDTWHGRLAVIERTAPGVWERAETLELPDLDYDYNYVWDLSWRPQAGSGLLIFRMRDETGRWLGAVDLYDPDGGWDYVLDNGSPIEMGLDSYPKWSSDGNEILFTDPEGNLVRWGYPDGPGQVVGSGGRADWQRDAVESTCSGDADCDDGKSCTEDACVAGTCINDPEPFEDAPCGEGGWCQNGSCFEPECSAEADCNDGNACTIDTCSDYECLFDETAATGLGCDDGDDCTIDDECDGFGGCAGTLDDTIPGCAPPSCLPKGDSCSTNDQCCSGQCHPVKGTCK